MIKIKLRTPCETQDVIINMSRVKMAVVTILKAREKKKRRVIDISSAGPPLGDFISLNPKP